MKKQITNKRYVNIMIMVVLVSILGYGLLGVYQAKKYNKGIIVEAARVYKSYKYRREIDFIRSFVSYLSQGNVAEIKRMSTKDALFWDRPEYFNEAQKLLKKVDINTMKLLWASEEKKNGRLYHIEVFFEDDTYQYMKFIIIKNEDGMLVTVAYFSDVF